jgi:hypothetical protein
VEVTFVAGNLARVRHEAEQRGTPRVPGAQWR